MKAKNLQVHQGGLMRCCLHSLSLQIEEAPEAEILPGDQIKCRSEHKYTMIVDDKGVVRWNEGNETQKPKEAGGEVTQEAASSSGLSGVQDQSGQGQQGEGLQEESQAPRERAVTFGGQHSVHVHSEPERRARLPMGRHNRKDFK